MSARPRFPRPRGFRAARHPNALAGFGLAAVVALALYLRWSNFVGVLREDSFLYVDGALGLLRREPVFAEGGLSHIHAVRLAMILPVAMSLAALGATEVHAVLWPLVCSVASVPLLYFVGRRLFGVAVGLLAAVILALYPLEILHATQLLPDAVVPAFLLLATYSYLRADDSAGRRGRIAWLLAAGAALGAGYYARLNAPVLLLFFGAHAALCRRLGRDFLWLLVGLGAVALAGEAFFVAVGGPIGYGILGELRGPDIQAGIFRPFGPSAPSIGFAGMMHREPILGPWSRAFLSALATLLALRPRRWWVAPLWFGVLFAYLELLSQVPVTTLPNKEDRMLTIVAAPLALTIAAALVAAVRRLRATPARVALVAAAAIAGLQLVALPALEGLRPRIEFLDYRYGPPRRVASVLRELPGREVAFTVPDWPARVNLYLRYAPPALAPAGPARSAYLAEAPPAAGPRAGTASDAAALAGRAPLPVTLRRLTIDDRGRPLDAAEGYVVHSEEWGLEVRPDWVLFRRLPAYYTIPASSFYYVPDPDRPIAGAHEARLTLDRRVSPDLTVVNVALGPRLPGGAGTLALDWVADRPAPRAALTLELIDRVGLPRASLLASLDDPRAFPTELWRPGGIYHRYYSLPFVGVADDLGLRVAVDGGPGVEIGPIVPPARADDAILLEGEGLDDITPDQDASLGSIAGWASYRRGGYSGGRAAIARVPGARAAARVPPLAPGDHRVWLRVFSYGADQVDLAASVNRLGVTLNGQPAEALWRAGEPGLGWVAVDFAGNPGGDRLELEARAIGQPFLIVDLIAIEPAPPETRGRSMYQEEWSYGGGPLRGRADGATILANYRNRDEAEQGRRALETLRAGELDQPSLFLERAGRVDDEPIPPVPREVLSGDRLDQHAAWLAGVQSPEPVPPGERGQGRASRAWGPWRLDERARWRASARA